MSRRLTWNAPDKRPKQRKTPVKAWRFYAFGDMRLDDIELAACPPDHVLVEPLVVQPSATEAQLAFGIPTLAYDHVKSRLETGEQLLEKPMMFLLLFYSVLERGGAVVQGRN